eukprot:768293-Hanusia_phi.AAC.5
MQLEGSVGAMATCDDAEETRVGETSFAVMSDDEMEEMDGSGNKIQVLVRNWTSKTLVASLQVRDLHDLHDALQRLVGLPPQEQLVTIAGVACIKDEQVARLRPWSMIEVRPRCLGGKGGFGAMLRGQASRPGMKKVQANTGAMRDLSGRRIRHVEQEAQLQEWAAEEEKRREQLEKEKAAKRQKFAHNVHEEAVNYVAEAVVDRDSVTDAVKQGIVGEKTRKDVTSKEVPQAMRTAKKLDKIWNVDEFDDEDEEDGSVDQPQDKTSKQAAATETSEMQAKQAAARAKKVEKEEQIEKAEQKAEVAERPGATTGAAKEQEHKTAIKETVEKV